MINFLIGILSGVVFSYIWVYVAVSKYRIEKLFIKFTFFKKYHIHHSMFVPIVFLLLLFIENDQITLFLVGFSIGILIKHTLEDGFVFVTKNKDV